MSSVIILVISLLLCAYMAWNIGANDVANSMATTVGSKVMSARKAVVLAGIMTAVGAIFIGAHVANTISSKVLVVESFNKEELLIGFMAALLSAGLWITAATWKELPISTTHSIIGAIFGFGLVAGGLGEIHWDTIGFIALSWVLSPVCGALLAFIIFKIIVLAIFNRVDSARAAMRFSPVFVSMTFFVVLMSLTFKTNLGSLVGLGSQALLGVVTCFVLSLIAGFLGWGFIYWRFNKVRIEDESAFIEAIFRKLQVMTALYVALSIGANDVANAIGPFVGILEVEKSGSMPAEVKVPFWILLFGGLFLFIGMITWGYKVIRTVGQKITDLTNTRGFSIDFSTATVVLIASKLGMPISTTHTVVGAVIGIGLARGLSTVNFKIVRNIFTSWFLTLPIAAVTTIVIYLILTYAVHI